MNRVRNRKIAIALALVSTVLPIAGLHKFYLGQPRWGVVYLLLWFTPIPRIASALEGLWYLSLDAAEFQNRFSDGTISSPVAAPVAAEVSSIADALRQLDSLRQDGLVSDYEFEQKRRQILNL